MLSLMAKGFFSESSLMIFPLIALFLFIAVFTVITVRALRMDKETLHDIAGLPLADDLLVTNQTTKRTNP